MATISTQAPDGATLNIDVPEGTDPSQYAGMVDDVQAHYASTRQTPLETGARAALRNVPLGQQAAAMAAPVLNPLGLADKPDYSGELAHLTEAAEAGKAQNPKSYLAGAAAGTLAPMAIPGAGEALEAAPILGNAALGATQGLSDTNLTQNPGEIAKQAAIGGVGGAVAGGIGKALTSVAPTAEQMAATSTGKGLGATGRRLVASGLLSKNPDATMAALGNWIAKTATPEGEPLVSMATRPGQFFDNVQALHDQAGKVIGGVIDEMGEKLPVSVSRLEQDLLPVAKGMRISDPQARSQVLEAINVLKEEDEAGTLNFKVLNDVKGNIGEAVKNNPSMGQAYGKIADYIDKMLDAYTGLIKNPEMKENFSKAMLDYKNSSRILPILKYAEGRELAQGPMGNSGLLGLFGLASGVASGHPIGGAAAALGSAVGRPIANLVGRNAALKAVPMMPAIAAGGKKLNQAAMLELANALQNKFKK